MPRERRPSPVRGFSADWILTRSADGALDLGPPTEIRANHDACVEHVHLPGLRQPLCIVAGRDRELQITEALELLA